MMVGFPTGENLTASRVIWHSNYTYVNKIPFTHVGQFPFPKGFPPDKQVHVQGWAKDWSLGCVNSPPPKVRGSQEAGFTQSRDHSLAQPCTLLKTHCGDQTRGNLSSLRTSHISLLCFERFIHISAPRLRECSRLYDIDLH